MSDSTSLADFFSSTHASAPSPNPVVTTSSSTGNLVDKANSKPAKSNRSDYNIPQPRSADSSASSTPRHSPRSTTQSNSIDLSAVSWRVDEGSLYQSSSRGSTFNKQRFIAKQLELRASEYTDTKHVSIWTGTYNVNAKRAPAQVSDIEEWVCSNTLYDNVTINIDHNSTDAKYKSADIYVFGFQEIVDLDAKNFIIDHNACKPWQHILQQTLDKLSSSNQYTLIATVHLVGLALFVYCRTKIQQHISDIRTSTVGVGLMGVGGNKGAVIARMQVYNSGVCFVNTHLAAHQKNVKARNADYHSICKRAALLPPEIALQMVSEYISDDLRLNNEVSLMDSLSTNFNAIKTRVQKVAKDLRQRHDENAIDMTSDAHSIEMDGYGIFDHQHVFWIGDNNYRIDDLALDEVYELIEQQNWSELLSHEQLMQEKSRGNVFVEFEEGAISFPPTYKYMTGTNSYDRKETGKMRIPAYCDRIQWLGDRSVKQRYYTRAECTLSDHKPVMSLFKVPVNIEVDKRKAKVQKELSELTAETAWPSMAMSTRIIELGDVTFDQPIVQQLVLKNTGNSVIQFECLHRRHHTVDANGEATDDSTPEQASSKLPAWLKVTPANGVIQLNDTVTLTVRVRVARKAAAALNTMGDKSLLSLLLVKCTDGGYHSVGLRGNYQRTILGCPLSHLCKLNNMPIALTPAEQIRNNKKSVNVPLPVQTLVDYIDKQRPMDTDSFRPSNDATSDLQSVSESAAGGQLLSDSTVRNIIQMLDSGLTLKRNCDITSTLHTLRIVLLCLPSPLLCRPPATKQGVSEPLTDEHTRRRDRLRDARSEFTLNTLDIDIDNDLQEVYDVPTWCYHAMCEMPTPQYSTLMYVINLFRRIVSEADSKHIATQNLCNTFSPCLTFRPSQSTLSPTIPLKPNQILRHIIESEDYR